MQAASAHCAARPSHDEGLADSDTTAVQARLMQLIRRASVPDNILSLIQSLPSSGACPLQAGSWPCSAGSPGMSLLPAAKASGHAQLKASSTAYAQLSRSLHQQQAGHQRTVSRLWSSSRVCRFSPTSPLGTVPAVIPTPSAFRVHMRSTMRACLADRAGTGILITCSRYPASKLPGHLLALESRPLSGMPRQLMN